MKIKNVGEVINQIKPLLPTYLKDMGLESKPPLTQCPNYQEHDDGEDKKPSCGFIPDTNQEKFHCFACGSVGDIFAATALLEGRNIQGLGFYETVKYLADKYEISYELEEPTQEEKEFDLVQTFLRTIVNSAHKYLVKNRPEKALAYIKERNWTNSIKKFQLGYLPKSEKTKNFFKKVYTEHPKLRRLISISDAQIVGRLIYPIVNKHGTILGVIHRRISEEDIREKYIKHFIKSIKKEGVIFNLRGIDKRVYIVEGGSSVLTLNNVGIENSVAILGTGFNVDKYKNLVCNNIEEVVLCFDGDKGGEECLERVIKVVQNKPDLKIYVKKLPEGEDPDSIIIKSGVEAFKEIPEISLFKYQINKLKTKDDLKVRESLYSLILATTDNIIRERMIKLFTRELEVQKTPLLQELKKFEKLNSLDTDITIAEIEEEKQGLKDELEKFEERVWRVDKFLGLETGFPIFDAKMDGLQEGLHEIGGIWNVGKSAFMISMALNLLKRGNHVLYFSIDDPIQTKTLPRAMANLSRIPINVAANPYWRIQKNETLKEVEKIDLAQKRDEAYRLLEEMSPRFSIKDSSHGYDLAFVEKMIKIHKIIAEEKKLVVFIDFLHMVSVGKESLETTEALTKISRQLKHFSGLYNIPVVTTVEGTKEIGSTSMQGKHIKGSVSLQYSADIIILLTSDFYTNPKSQLYFKDTEDTGLGGGKPIVRVRIDKNKISGFKGEIFVKFYPELSLFEECSEEDQSRYRKSY